jgi:hypothetical protein
MQNLRTVAVLGLVRALSREPATRAAFWVVGVAPPGWPQPFEPRNARLETIVWSRVPHDCLVTRSTRLSGHAFHTMARADRRAQTDRKSPERLPHGRRHRVGGSPSPSNRRSRPAFTQSRAGPRSVRSYALSVRPRDRSDPARVDFHPDNPVDRVHVGRWGTDAQP